MLEFFFHASALSVLPFWAAMILFPNKTLTQRAVATPWIALPAALCYLAIGAPHAFELVQAFKQPSPTALATLTGTPWGASLFWAYAGAFDLFVGRWIFLDSRERGASHAMIAPILTVAIFFGPLAFALYALVCAGHRAAEEPAALATQPPS